MGIEGIVRFERTIESFSDDIEGGEEWSKFVRGIGIEWMRLIVFGTPVVTGETRGAWVLTFDTPSVGNPAKARRAARAISDGNARMNTYAGFRNVYITNNKPWILKLDAGSSAQARAGILDVATQFLRQSLNLTA